MGRTCEGSDIIKRMILQQFYLNCLAHASYVIGDESSKMAVVVDPQRDVEQYLAFAREQGLRITHVFLTHLHADFLAGHLELRDRTGATICLGAAAKAEYTFRPMSDAGSRPTIAPARLLTYTKRQSLSSATNACAMASYSCAAKKSRGASSASTSEFCTVMSLELPLNVGSKPWLCALRVSAARQPARSARYSHWTSAKSCGDIVCSRSESAARTHAACAGLSCSPSFAA